MFKLELKSATTTNNQFLNDILYILNHRTIRLQTNVEKKYDQ